MPITAEDIKNYKPGSTAPAPTAAAAGGGTFTAADIKNYKPASGAGTTVDATSHNLSDPTMNAMAHPSTGINAAAAVVNKMASWGMDMAKVAGNFGLGFAKEAGSHVAGMAEMITKPLDIASEKLFGIKAHGAGMIQKGQEKYLTPEGTAQKVGAGAEDIAEFFIPAGEAMKLSKAGEAAVGAAKLAEKGAQYGKLGARVGKLAEGALKTGVKSTVGATEMAGVQAFQTPKDKEAIKNAATVGAALPVVGAALSKMPVGKTLPKLTKKLGSVIKGKSYEELLAVPEQDVYKLSNGERAKYWQAQKKVFEEQHAAKVAEAEKMASTKQAAIKTEAPSKAEYLTEKAKALDVEATRASIKEAQALKPKLISSMKDSSARYQALVEKELKPHANVQVSASEMKTGLIKEYAETDPEKAKKIAEILGLGKNEDTTLGKMYEQAKSLRQQIGAGAKKGSRTFTSEEKDIDDAVSYLAQYMKSKGVNLAEANKFWSEYAPLRNKLVSKIQPFTPAGAESSQFGTFAEAIKKSVKGTDPKNESFIAATEKLLGTKIGSAETRAAMAKMTQAEKEKVAAELAQAQREAAVELEKQQAKELSKEGLTQQQKELIKKEYESNREAKTRDLTKSILKKLGYGALIGVGGESAYKLFTK